MKSWKSSCGSTGNGLGQGQEVFLIGYRVPFPMHALYAFAFLGEMRPKKGNGVEVELDVMIC
jgi:hypothetical protein